jgi:hypothetical protein
MELIMIITYAKVVTRAVNPVNLYMVFYYLL